MITIQRERFIDCIDQVMSLCVSAQALEASATGLELDLDLDLFQQFDELDVLHCLTMRKDGKPIGIHWIYITATPRHKGKILAHTDVIYVDPEHRQHSMKLIDASQSYIAERADMWLMASRDYADRSKLWQRKGFNFIENIYLKVV